MNRLAILMLVLLWSQSSFALTLKSGQVIGQDGNVYDGASPEMKEAIINRGDVAGISGSNIYVIIQGEVAFIPIIDVIGKSKEGITQKIQEVVGSGFDINQADTDVTNEIDDAAKIAAIEAAKQTEEYLEAIERSGELLKASESLSDYLEAGGSEADMNTIFEAEGLSPDS